MAKAKSFLTGDRYTAKAMFDLYGLSQKKGWTKHLHRKLKLKTERDRFYNYLNKAREKDALKYYNKANKRSKVTAKQKYKEYLKSDHWKSVREHFKGHPCLSCGTKMNIDIHHTSYENKGEFKKEINDCIPLCRDCHQEVHDHHNKNKDISLKEATNDILHK